MPAMLSRADDDGPALRDVLPSCLAAVQGRDNRLGLPPARSAVVVLVDGLGAESLAARAGHARTLAARLTKRSRVTSGFPTTTAAALTSLTTGTDPGTHGMVGYSALDPAADRVVNLLRGFDDGSVPLDFQRAPTVFEHAGESGVRALAVGPRHYSDTGFTRAVLRGAEYLGARTIESRFDAVAEALRAGGPAIAYLYVPELDTAAHAEGWGSARWTEQLEVLDAALAHGLDVMPQGTALVVTADHGMVDVPADRHVVYGEVPGLLDGVRFVAGEPRCLQLHLDEAVEAGGVGAKWSAALRDRATVVTRDDAIASGWFGAVDRAVAPRIGDVLVAARGVTAFYREADAKGRRMVGQHGSWSRAERIVPLLRFGAATD